MKYVVNYDFPGNIEQYIHRVGRAGRTDDGVGIAFSLLPRNMSALAPALVSLLRQCGQTIERNLLELATSQVPVLDTESETPDQICEIVKDEDGEKLTIEP